MSAYSSVLRYRLELVEECPDYQGAALDARNSAALAAFLIDVVKPYRHREVAGALLVDYDYRVMEHTMPYHGITDGVLIEPRQLLATALLASAPGMVLYHCHPARNVQPSQGDFLVTSRVRDAGEVVGIRLLDHVIVGHDPGRYTSLRDDHPRRVVLFDFADVVVVRELDLGPLRRKDGRSEVQPKYRDTVNPLNTWSGRGNRPRWLAARLAEGFQLEDFRIDQPVLNKREIPHTV